MAKGTVNVAAQCSSLIAKIEAGEFSPIYLLMGDEPYYLDLVCNSVIEHSLDEFSRDFNETVCYGADVDAETVITAARRFPMMAERQLVVVKDAQAMKDLEHLAIYCENPLDSTILVLLMRGASADKRKSLYKQCLKNGVVVESNALRDYEMAPWITQYCSSRGIMIDPEAAALLAEYAGTDMSKIVVETDKLLKNLPEGTGKITSVDIEKNEGSMIVNIGAQTTRFSIITGGKIIISRKIPIGGRQMNEAICSEVRKRYNLQIGTRTGKRLKIVMGRLSDQRKEARKVVGIDSVSGLPREEIISAYVVNDGIMNCVNEIAAEMKTFLERTPPQIAYHVAKEGIFLTGGSTRVPYIDQYLASYTGFAFNLSPLYENSAVAGLEKIMKNRDLRKWAQPIKQRKL